MSILIDTNVFLWVSGIEGKLSDTELAFLTDPDVPVFVSSITAWEIAIKWSKKRLTLPAEPAAYVESVISAAGLTRLVITFSDVYACADLRHAKHKDPFDRMLVAQAKRNSLRLMTSDSVLADYGVEVINCKIK